MEHRNGMQGSTRQIRLVKRSPTYWRVTFDNPPLNIFGPEAIPQLNEIVTALETDTSLKVVVFDSAVEGFFLTHYDFFAKMEDSTSLPTGPTGLQQLPDMLVRISHAPVASIAMIRGRATGRHRRWRGPGGAQTARRLSWRSVKPAPLGCPAADPWRACHV